MSLRGTTLKAQPCPFCGGPPIATRIENTRTTRNHVSIGCAKLRRCDATLLMVRGSSFGDAVMRWNMRHVASTDTAYHLRNPVLGDTDTIGVLVP